MKRIKWIDDTKTFACVLVVLGHFLQSMVKANIIRQGYIYNIFINDIYLFHVNLFFICSGYIYQKQCLENEKKESKKKIIKNKFFSLIIPMIIFAGITWCMKYIGASSVNSTDGSFINSVIISPVAPYWFLQTLFLIFLITPQIKNKKSYIVLILISLAANIIINSLKIYIPSTIYRVLKYEVWFVYGMVLSEFERKINHIVNVKLNIIAILNAVVFIITSTIAYNNDFNNQFLNEILGVIASNAVILFFISINNINLRRMYIFEYIGKYMFPIYLMHTIFAAPLRIVLLKIGICNAYIHFIAGISISFLGPILYMQIAKIPYMNWLIYLVYPKLIEQRKVRGV